ncbi:Argininosuccinate lyase [Candidatus Vidania fulgoroideae]|nr:Argininosuccinate lyase [Candidatus Vidania fulgoroideae]
MKWSSRFKKKINKNFISYTNSIKFDRKFFHIDLLCCYAHAEILKNSEVIKKKELKKLKKCILDIKKKKIKLKLRKNLEDIHLNIENLIIKKEKKIGNKIRTARSRNDLVTTELRFFIKKKTEKIFKTLKKLIYKILCICKKKIDVIMPSFTHMQIAQPTLLSHHLLAYKEMFLRDLKRLKYSYKSADYLILGSCAVVGTSIRVDREELKKKLGFKKVNRNSLDGVSDRDYVIDFCHSCSMIMMHISRMSEEFIIWSSKIFDFIELPDEYSSGSSMMPQKKNPDIFEVSRSRTSLVVSNLISIYSIMKCLPLSYNKDYQEDKRISFSTYKITLETLKIFNKIIKKIKFNKKKMFNSSKKDFSLATDIAEKMTKEGVPYKKAHKTVSSIVSKYGKYKEFKKIPSFFFLKNGLKKKTINWIKKLTIKKSIKSKKNIGNTSIKLVKYEIKMSKKKIRKVKIH